MKGVADLYQGLGINTSNMISFLRIFDSIIKTMTSISQRLDQKQTCLIIEDQY